MLMRPCVKCWKGARAFSSGVNLLHEGLRLQHLGDWAAALSAFRGAAQNSPMLGAAANNAEGLLLLRSSVPVAHGTRELQRGDVLLAPWAEDGFDYEAILEEMDEASDTCTVAWSDGGQTCRVVPRAAVTTLQGLSHRDDRATRLWASRRALRRALLDWQGQAEAGVAHDAFVDFAGLVCDLAAAEIRIALISSWPGLELAQNLLKRGSFTAERAYAPDPRALAALYSTRAEVLRFNSGANLREVQLLHLRVADHLRAASWRDKPRWESPAGHLGWEILHEVQWAKALAQMAWSEQAQPRSRPNASTKRRKAQVPATASVWALPEKLLPPTPGLPRGPDLLLHHSCALQSVGRAWRALHWAAHRDAPKSLPWTYSAESVRDFVATLPVTAVHVRLLLEVAILVFVIGCRWPLSRQKPVEVRPPSPQPASCIRTAVSLSLGPGFERGCRTGATCNGNSQWPGPLWNGKSSDQIPKGSGPLVCLAATALAGGRLPCPRRAVVAPMRWWTAGDPQCTSTLQLGYGGGGAGRDTTRALRRCEFAWQLPIFKRSRSSAVMSDSRLPSGLQRSGWLPNAHHLAKHLIFQPLTAEPFRLTFVRLALPTKAMNDLQQQPVWCTSSSFGERQHQKHLTTHGGQNSQEHSSGVV
ncbi:unnamed protein product [Durusdinium trenchii]|uniref:Uncharacterized protein n=1 Tax=Durusdinium trenchii TaxID=1381693 RepID=A0ABP0JVJ4_9DINO